MHRSIATIPALILTLGLLTACNEEKANQVQETTPQSGQSDSAGAADDGAQSAPADAGETAGADSEASDKPAAGATEGDASKSSGGDDAAAGGDAAAAGGGGVSGTPQEAVASTEKGQLKNPYTDVKSVAEEGHKLYMSFGCNGCHGGTGGGGMGPPLTNPVWIYGSDDDTLFRFTTLGSDAFQKETGASRKGSENVVGPMPPLGGANIDSADDLWKVIAWMRSINPDGAN